MTSRWTDRGDEKKIRINGNDKLVLVCLIFNANKYILEESEMDRNLRILKEVNNIWKMT